MCVLLVETEPGIRTLLQRHLHLLGLEVVEVSSGEEALTTFADHRESIQVIVTGELGGFMDGGELLKSVRHIDPEMPVYFFLAHSLPPEVLCADNVEIFEKPDGARILCQAVANLIATLEKPRERFASRRLIGCGVNASV